MPTARIDWPNLPIGARLVPIILVHGIPIALTPGGVNPTTVAVTAGSTIDDLFWPGVGALSVTLPDSSTLGLVQDLLDPREKFETFEKVNLLKTAVQVEPFTFSVQNIGGRATALISNREGRITQLLGANLDQGATTVTLGNPAGFPSTGIACIGKETITYSGVTGSDLTGVVRGLYGSKDRLHTSPASHRPTVTSGLPPHWQGRLCTFWVALLSEDGTTLTDPTLEYVGTVGAGVQMTKNLTTWSVTLDHITESLARKISTPVLQLYGYSHFDRDSGAQGTGAGGFHPLAIDLVFRASGVNTTALLSLGDAETGPNAANDRGGWHPTAQTFFEAADRYARAYPVTTGGVSLGADGRVTINMTYNFASSTSRLYVNIRPSWDLASQWALHEVIDEAATWASSKSAPEACFPLSGWVKIPRDEDYALVPSSFTYTYPPGGGSVPTGTATISLVADTSGLEKVTCDILEVDSSRQRIRVGTSLMDIVRVQLAALASPAGALPLLLCTKRTSARLAITANGDNPVVALRAASLAIDALCGQDHFDDVIDWDDLSRALAVTAVGSLPQTRSYNFDNDSDSFLDVLIQELRLRGMILAVRYGRLTGVRLQNFGNSEATVSDVLETDIVCDSSGREVSVGVVDNTGAPLASSMEFEVPNGTSKPDKVTVTDSTFQSEFGTGETLKCSALLTIPRGLYPEADRVNSTLYSVVQQVLGPLAEPNRALEFPLSANHLGLQPGMLVRVTHSRIPTWEGGAGFTNVICQVQEVRRELFGGSLRATVVFRFQSGSYYGYAPEALIASGNTGSSVITIDTSSAWGATCFASEFDPSGESSVNALDGFEVGDAVVLSQIGTVTPAADQARTIMDIDYVANTVTLDAPPASNISVQYTYLLRFAPYSSCTTRQKTLFAWIADQTTQLLNGSDDGKRWAP